MFKKLAMLVVALMFSATAAAQAVEYKLTFSIDYFGVDYTAYYPPPAPINTSSGVFYLSAPSSDAPFTSFAAGPGAYFQLEDSYWLMSLSGDDQKTFSIIGGPNPAIERNSWTVVDRFQINFFADQHVQMMYSANGYTYTGYGTSTLQALTVPEPETYAMLLAGLGLMVYVVGRRKNQA